MKTGPNLILWKSIACLAFATIFTLQVTAQSYPYTVDFENTTPGNKSYADTSAIIVDNISWTMPGVYFGAVVTPPGDFFNGAKSGRMRLSNNSTGDPGHMTMLSDLPSGIGILTFHTAMYSSETGGRLVILYSNDEGSSWVPVGDTVDVPVNSTPLTVSRIIEQTGAVRVSIRKAETSNVRINIDDISMTEFNPQTNILVTSMAPTGDDVSLSTNALTLSFDQDVLAASGSICLCTTGGDSTLFLVPDDVLIDSNTVTVPGVILENASHYYVQITAGAFTDSTGLLPNLAIDDTTTWIFSTLDTTPVMPINSLNETFTSCTNAAMGVFRQYSVVGDKVWHCSPIGHGDDEAVEINGGAAEGVSETNEDWLISVVPFDFSNMNHPELRLWQKRQFDGQVERSIRISTDYSGAGDPNLATWSTLDVQELSISPEADTWTAITGIGLETYQSTPFYLAFTYTCGSAGAYALSYDDIQVTESVGISELAQERPGVYILGQPTTDAIRLKLLLTTHDKVSIRVTDLSGRIIHSQPANVQEGSNILTIHPAALQAGMYLISVQQGRHLGMAKAVIP